MGRGRNALSKVRGHTPWVLLICLLVMAIIVTLLVPIMGFMYKDMWNATNEAIRETNKMKELRRKMFEDYRRRDE